MTEDGKEYKLGFRPITKEILASLQMEFSHGFTLLVTHKEEKCIILVGRNKDGKTAATLLQAHENAFDVKVAECFD